MSLDLAQIRVESYEVGWIYAQLNKNLLFVDNSFQRRYVWQLKDKIRLIETILLGYTIPEVYLWKTETNPNTGESLRSIVDGQQRLIALRSFIDNEFPLKSNCLDFPNQEYQDLFFKDLNDDLKTKIWSYTFSVRMISEKVTKSEITQIFNRLNSTSYDLNPQELRNAKFDGKFLALSLVLADNDFWNKYNFFPGLLKRRMRDVEFVSSILIYFRQGISYDLEQESIDEIYRLYETEYESLNQDKENFIDIINELEKIIIFSKGDRYVINFLKKLTHLYTLMIYISFLKHQEKSWSENSTKNILNFILAYNDNAIANEILTLEQILILQEYKKLCLEGTKSKTNRLERLSCIKNLFNIFPV